jgi:hypothetical protein
MSTSIKRVEFAQDYALRGVEGNFAEGKASWMEQAETKATSDKPIPGKPGIEIALVYGGSFVLVRARREGKTVAHFMAPRERVVRLEMHDGAVDKVT